MVIRSARCIANSQVRAPVGTREQAPVLTFSADGPSSPPRLAEWATAIARAKRGAYPLHVVVRKGRSRKSGSASAPKCEEAQGALDVPT